MIASLVFVFSLGALGQFGIAYCRTQLLAYNKVELSPRVREVADIGERLAPSDFDRLLQLVRLAPPLVDDATEIRAVSMYFGLARVAGTLVSPVSRKAAQWFEGELVQCSYFAAVALDRRLVATD
jgi:hypothetical protein